jgi:FtsP/CotA-like multicopper oxidase with cupredoxin domain
MQFNSDAHPRPALNPGLLARRLRWLVFSGSVGLSVMLGILGLQGARSEPAPPPAPTALTPMMAGMPVDPPGSSPTAPVATPSPLALSMGQLMSGMVDTHMLGFDPNAILTDFDSGVVTHLPNGQIRRDYTIVERDRRIELAPGVFFDAWTFNGRVPGPTLRATEGDLVHVTFINAGSAPHSIHFHGIHPADQDGLEVVDPGAQRIYEFTAGPVGLHLYHCHIEPLAQHIDRGLYGVFIVDPRIPRAPAHELVMMMNAFDLDGNGENDIYAVNSVPFAYYYHPIAHTVGEKVRIYLSTTLYISNDEHIGKGQLRPSDVR